MKPTDKAILGMVSELPGRVAACSPARDITLPCWRSRLDWMERRTRPKAEVAESHTVCAIAPLVPRQVTSLLLIDRSADRPEARNAPSCTVKSPTVLLCPHLHLFRLTPNFLCLNLQYVLYVYTSHVTVTPNRYRHTLEKLTGEPPATKTALISVLLPEIESALASGKTRRQIWQRLVEDGFDLSYDTFHSTLWRVQRKPRITAAPRRKTLKVSNVEVEELTEEAGHDPLANLRKVEQSRPGFHYRGTENLDVLVHGRRESRDQNKR